jgi:NADH dehydrogenase
LESQPNFYNIPGANEYTFTLKTIDQGMALRNHILYCFEQATCETDEERRREWLTFNIVGGGPTGVEFAGALAELIEGSLRKDYPKLDVRQARVLLLEASDNLLKGFPPELGEYAKRRLEKMGVEVSLNSRVVKISPDSVQMYDGEVLHSKTAIWTAGVHGVPGAEQWGLPLTPNGQVKVLPTLQAPDHPEVYIAGDLAWFEQDGQPLPQVAQVAIQQGKRSGENILRQIQGQAPLPFHYRDKGMLAEIGRNAAAAQVWGRSFTGFLAWILWLGVHISYLIGFRNRIVVLINWAWDYLFWERGVRDIAPANMVNPIRVPEHHKETM